jgi:tetratricopeptide (TPR) repeat protein
MAEPLAKPQTAQADPADLLQLAAAQHRRGQLREAEALYRQVLDSQPGHFDALHLCGVLMQQRGRSEEALALISAALAANAGAAPAHSNHGLVLAALGRTEEALAAYDRAIALKPDYAEALYNRGNALAALGRADDALASFEQAIALRPDYAAALLNRAQVLHRLGRAQDALDGVECALARKPDGGALALRGRLLRELDRNEDALASFTRALELAPDDADTLIARGNTYYDMKSFAAALADYERALSLRPDAAPIHNNRGNALRELGRGAEALEAFGRALALKPGYAEAYNNRGNAQLELNRPSAALADYDRALALKPDYADALVNRGSALRYLNRPDDAIESLDRAIALNPELAEAHWNRALTCLASGDFEQGWQGYEWRWRRNNAEMMPRDFAQPQWRGEDLRGRTILLHAEQGFGDTIQFIRYLPMVLAKGGKVVLEIPDDLKPLVDPGDGVAAMVSRGQALPPFELHCPLLSLPLAFGTTLANVPAPPAYLRAPAGRIEQWRTRLPHGKAPRVGLAWSGKPTHKNDHNRSIALARLAPLLLKPGFQFVSLQKEVRDADRAALKKFPALVRIDDALADFADTAAVMASLDLVIAVDTAVAHLAGAMGKPVWILLPAIGDWRWLLAREDSPWYPSARLFRQPHIGDWGSVIARLGRELAVLA